MELNKSTKHQAQRIIPTKKIKFGFHRLSAGTTLRLDMRQSGFAMSGTHSTSTLTYEHALTYEIYDYNDVIRTMEINIGRHVIQQGKDPKHAICSSLFKPTARK